jgi:hypothetical protein
VRQHVDGRPCAVGRGGAQLVRAQTGRENVDARRRAGEDGDELLRRERPVVHRRHPRTDEESPHDDPPGLRLADPRIEGLLRALAYQ